MRGGDDCFPALALCRQLACRQARCRCNDAFELGSTQWSRSLRLHERHIATPAHPQDVGYLRVIAAPLAASAGCCHRLAFLMIERR